MIIFGTTGLNSTKERGAFNCPRCSMQRGYRWISVNRFFTLYFIPLIPLGTRYLDVCTVCGRAIDVPRDMAERAAVTGRV